MRLLIVEDDRKLAEFVACDATDDKAAHFEGGAIIHSVPGAGCCIRDSENTSE
jgi:hypothetical protein